MKAVLITGASSGIGAATALEFAKNNYHVFLLARDTQKLASLNKQIAHSTSIACDLQDAKSVEKAVETILSQKNLQIECLVNNAGIYAQHFTADGTDDLWMQQFQTNLFGAVRITRPLFSYFSRQGGGSIVNVSSTLGLKPTANTAAYSASKAAMVNWTQSLALEGGPLGVRCNVVCPGIVDTPIHGFNHLPQNEAQKVKDSLKSAQPLGRIGLPEEIARSIYFLGSPDSSWTTGAVLAVDGGINIT